MMEPGDVISHTQMCAHEGKNLQAGMHFGIAPDHSVVLMSTRSGAPYGDEVLENGRVIIYEGHDVPKSDSITDPKTVDQPLFHQSGPTQNGKFYKAAEDARNGSAPPEQVRVYEKIKRGIWVFNGTFRLVDAWQQREGDRTVCKFRLEAIEDLTERATSSSRDVEMTTMIPSDVKREVWARDRGRCQVCGSEDNLHFDHIIPYSKGGSSLVAENIQLLCARHNLVKRDKIQ